MFRLRVDGAIRLLQERPGSLAAAATEQTVQPNAELARLGDELQRQIGRFRS